MWAEREPAVILAAVLLVFIVNVPAHRVEVTRDVLVALAKLMGCGHVQVSMMAAGGPVQIEVRCDEADPE